MYISIRFSPDSGLPDSGLLNLFYAHSPEAEIAWYEEGFGYAEFHASPEGLAPRRHPEMSTSEHVRE